MIETIINAVSRPYAGFFSLLFFLIVFFVLWSLLGKKFKLQKSFYLTVLFIIYMLISYWIIFEGYFRFVYRGSDGFTTLQIHKRWNKRNITLNDIGFRDVIDYGPLKEKDNLVCLLGDSMQAGNGVSFDESVTARLREKLSRFQFLNIAKPGWSTEDQFSAYSRLISSGYRFKIVVLNYFLNDIDYDNMLALKSRPPSLNHAVKMLRFSYSAQFIFARFTQFYSKGTSSYSSALINEFHGPVFKRHKTILLRLLLTAKSNDAHVMVVLWPVLPVQSDGGLNAMREKVIDVLKTNNIEYSDIYPLLDDLEEKTQIAGRYDRHASPVVHAIIADSIADWISRNH